MFSICCKDMRTKAWDHTTSLDCNYFRCCGEQTEFQYFFALAPHRMPLLTSLRLEGVYNIAAISPLVLFIRLRELELCWAFDRGRGLKYCPLPPNLESLTIH